MIQGSYLNIVLSKDNRLFNKKRSNPKFKHQIKLHTYLQHKWSLKNSNHLLLLKKKQI